MTWTELEERRRVWWAIYILDRTISLGSRRRFCFPDPADTDVLPVDDDTWVSTLLRLILYIRSRLILSPIGSG